MNHSKLLIFISLVFISFFSLAQNYDPKSLALYQKGIEMFQDGKYKEADSLFSLSISVLPQFDTYYRLALTKMRENDTCGYCENLKNAKKYGDNNAGDLFEYKCLIKRKINFDNRSHPDTLLYAYFSKYICTNKIVSRKYYIKNLKTGYLSFYDEIEKDSVNENDKIIPGTFPDFGKFSKNESIYTSDEPIYSFVENMPTYPGGDDVKIKFLTNNIQYPKLAKESGIQGMVILVFIVEIDGSINDIELYKGIGGGCDEEAMRVVKLFPKWNPGIMEGKPVRVRFIMPIKFTIN